MTDSSDLLARLEKTEEAYKKAPTERVSELPEDGDYQAIFRDVKLIESKAGVAYLIWTFEVDESDPKYAGFEVPKFYCLEPRKQGEISGYDVTSADEERTLGYLKQDIAKFGVEVPESITEVIGGPLYDDMLDRPVALAIKINKKGTKQNVFINEVLGSKLTSDITPQSMLEEVEPVAESNEVDTKSTDDIPF
jgi:hypothetical protein